MKYYALAKGIHLGIFLIGAGLAVGGIESLYSRRMSLRFSEDAAEGYSGFPALVWGTMLLLAGVALIGYAYLQSGHTLCPRIESDAFLTVLASGALPPEIPGF